MNIKQKLSSGTTGDFDVRYYKRPEKHIVERLTFENRDDAWEYCKQNNIEHGGIPWDKDGNSYIVRKIWEEPTWENKAKYRME